LEDQITIVEEAKSHGKSRRSRRRQDFWWRWTRDFRSLPHRFRTPESRAKGEKAKPSGPLLRPLTRSQDIQRRSLRLREAQEPGTIVPG